jgi:UTP--glucose-1-phosphate uridylyltransferase
MLPAAKVVAKELLPVLDRPAIQWVIEEAADAGCRDVTLVISPGKQAVLDHFRPAPLLESRIRGTKREALIESIDRLMRDVNIEPAMQHEQLGLGHAVLCAKSRIGAASFMCLLGDAVFSGSPAPARQLIDAYNRFGGIVIGLERVPAEKVDRYGIAEGREVETGLIRIDRMVEKPRPSETTSRLAVAARYILPAEVFEAIESTSRGTGNEIQLTDAIAKLIVAGTPAHGVVLSARRHDIGNPRDWLATNLAMARLDPTYKDLLT